MHQPQRTSLSALLTNSRGSPQQPGMLNEEYDLERVHAG